MIGLVINPNDEGVVREFFELFKTPWEFWRCDGRYDVVICSQPKLPALTARLVIWYGNSQVGGNAALDFCVQSRLETARLFAGTATLPIYGNCLTFKGVAVCGMVEESSGAAVAVAAKLGETKVLRLGFDLFDEVRRQLTQGQPVVHAHSPTIDRHIELLRSFITNEGLLLVEVPPMPFGHPFIVCLTHDVDHPVLRKHCCDYTMLGFLYRATIGSLVAVVRGRMSFRQVFRNALTAVLLPCVQLGIAPDPWRRSLLEYLELERGLGSTFFFVPFRNQPGLSREGKMMQIRAVPYGLDDVRAEVASILEAGCEVGVHGIDAWRDCQRGRAELDEVAARTGNQEMGVRMHWLYFDEMAPAKLEEAGYSYDSSVGFNETVGYRAGTTQAFKPLTVSTLLEVPLHLMDTALFYPDRLNLAAVPAREVVNELIGKSERFGGVLTINWHDRSIAPERLWDDFYRWLLGELRAREVWFPTAGQAVAWFRKRRSVGFDSVSSEPGRVNVKATISNCNTGPELRLRIHRPAKSKPPAPDQSQAFVDIPFPAGGEYSIAV